MSAEQWRSIPLAPGYEASDRGGVRSFRKGAPAGGRLLTLVPKRPDSDYRVVRILYAGKWQVRLVHQLVLEAFVGPRPSDSAGVRHLNDHPADNRLENLAWGTAAENMRDRVTNGIHHFSSRQSCKYGHAYTPENTSLRPTRSGGGTTRVCLTCQRARNARSRDKRRAGRIETRELRAA